jgi:hypothetical protein
LQRKPKKLKGSLRSRRRLDKKKRGKRGRESKRILKMPSKL